VSTATARRLLELQGSEVAGVQANATGLRVRFAAASVRHEGEDGYLSGVALQFGAARWQGDLAVCVGSVARAEILHAGSRYLRLPVDFVSAATVRAEFVFHNGECLTVEAGHLVVDVARDAHWSPSLAC
jgi:hypothetical protein